MRDTYFNNQFKYLLSENVAGWVGYATTNSPVVFGLSSLVLSLSVVLGPFLYKKYKEAKSKKDKLNILKSKLNSSKNQKEKSYLQSKIQELEK